MPKEIEFKAFRFSVKEITDDGEFTGYLSVFDNVDLGKDRVRHGAFKKTLAENHVFPLFYVHNSAKIPAGDFTAEEDQRGLKMNGKLYLSDFEGKPLMEPRQLHMAMKRKAVTGLSMGYETIKENTGTDGVRDLSEVRLFEGSVCPWPMNTEARVTDIKSETKAAIPYHDYGKAPEGEAWDGPAEIAKASPADLKAICAWYDAENPDVKSSYKLPHHHADGHKAVWRGVAAAMGALLGSRGGVSIPESDRRGVYGHLAKHYAEFNKEAPDFKTLDELEQEIKSGQIISDGSAELIRQSIESLEALLKTDEPQSGTRGQEPLSDSDLAPFFEAAKSAVGEIAGLFHR